MAEPKSDEITKLKEENEALKKKLNPLTYEEKSRINELHGLLAATPSYDKKFEDLKKEFLELKERSRILESKKYDNVTDNIIIGD